MLGALLLAPAAHAQQGLNAPPLPTLEATPAAAAPPVVDGDVLGDPAWAAVPFATGFRQTNPDEGQPATERTEVRVLFTADTLYVGVVCYDRDPDAIIVTDSRRDSSLSDSDSFQLIFDTFLDKQNGFVFGTSPAGQEYDGQVVNEGVGGSGMGRGGASRGGGGGFNLNWDGVWQVRAQVSDIGWSAEFGIPFRTLRYPPGDSQTWGVNFQRTIRRRNETAYWAPLTLQYNLFRVSQAGQLRGLQVPAGDTENLQLTPYVTGEAIRLDADPARGTTAVGDVGADLKYSVTSGLTLDATWNTDFAQVEVDEQQINLDRFNLYFPEKRPFFLENAGAFAVSNAGGAVQGDPAQTELFFSRRIGIEQGRVVPILAGARLSGKVSNAVSVGFLNMQTEEIDGLTPANNFTVARLRHDLPNRSSIGGLLVNRQATGRLAGDRDYNRTYAFDGRVGIGQDMDILGFVGRTETPGRDGRDHAYNVGANYESQTWRFQGGFMESGEDFNPEVGFTRRVGFRKVDGGIFYTWRPENFLKSFELRPHVTFNRFWDFNGFMETSLLHMDNRWEFEDSSSLITAWNVRGEGVREAFEISGIPVPPGEYEWSEGNIWFNYNRSAPVNAGVRLVFGGFFGGDILSVRSQLNARYAETFNLSLIWTRNDIDLPGGSVVTNLVGTRVAYNFSPRLFAQSLVQYNDSERLWSVNFRFGWLQDANTGLFLVYNETEGIDQYIPSGAGRSLILKYSYLFDLLD
ncbi:MAG: DUF5916 domain-containing protein [Acidobacteria bacterium]|nr:DUF5916 domain-containing protein [Acidobacteriota bacterium]